MARLRSTQAELQDREDRGVRLCPRCRLEKGEDGYTPSTWAGTGGNRYCRDCNKAYNATRYSKDPERFKGHERAKRRAAGAKEAHPGIRNTKRIDWAGKLKALCGLSVLDYAWALHDQGFHCALCEATELVVDHSHATGTFRGLLCSHHNLGLGMLGDDAPSLRRALAYLAG